MRRRRTFEVNDVVDDDNDDDVDDDDSGCLSPPPAMVEWSEVNLGERLIDESKLGF